MARDGSRVTQQQKANRMKNQDQTELISAKGIESAIASLNALRQEMTFLTALAPNARRSRARITPATLTLMESAVEAVRENRSLIPPSIVLELYEAKVQAARGLSNLLNKLQELCSDVQDTLSTVGQEANNTTQQVRVVIRTVAKTTPTPGLKLLSQRLNPRSGRSTPREAPAVTPAAVTPASVAVAAPGAGPPSETKAA